MQPDLIALDLDGTAVVYEPELAVAPELVALLEDLATRGVRWCINSDRFYTTQMELALALRPAARPAALCSIQRYVHWHIGNGEYKADTHVNAGADAVHAPLWATMRPHFKGWMDEILTRFPVVQHIADDIVLAVMTEPESIEPLREHMEKLVAPYPDAFVSGNLAWAFIVHRDFSKGRVLRQAATHLNIPRERILAIGDGFNDIPMLNGTHAAFCGCPANAEDRVKDAVRAAGGHVSEKDGPEGTIDIIRRIFP